uniref:Uncharacterized protein n=1 Tax=Sphingomonas sp. JE1 TaxID=1628059 RepID=A0A0D4ZZH5_9SPHN|nr:hypothetical protein pJE1_235 [Sphingomonas sp. JE1]
MARSRAALKGVSARLAQSWIFLSTKRGIPRYSVDENDPTCIIRRLDGQTARVPIVDRQFVEIK